MAYLLLFRSGMRFGIIGLFLLLGFLRLHHYRKEVDLEWVRCLESQTHKGLSTSVSGSLIPLWEGRWGVDRPEREGYPTPASWELTSETLNLRTDFGHEETIAGPFRCHGELRNQGRVDDHFGFYNGPKFIADGPGFTLLDLTEKQSIRARLRAGFSAWLNRLFAHSPSVRGFVRAVWTGELDGLPENIQTYYKEAGLLHLLTSSGQHVNCLLLIFFWTLAHVFPKGLVNFPKGRQIFCLFKRWGPTFCSVLLFLVSPPSPALTRTLFYLFSVACLRTRALVCSARQVVCSGIAMNLILNPQLFSSVGFLLSAVAMLLLIEVLGSLSHHSFFRQYFFFSISMPILMIPSLAFFFVHFSFFSTLHWIGWAWFWDIVLIPIGFLFPLIVALFPTVFSEWIVKKMGAALSILWTAHAKWISLLPTGYHVALRPTLMEAVLLTFVLYCVVRWVLSLAKD